MRAHLINTIHTIEDELISYASDMVEHVINDIKVQETLRMSEDWRQPNNQDGQISARVFTVRANYAVSVSLLLNDI